MNICILFSVMTLAGRLNCPFLVPSVPNLLQSLLNTQMRLLLRSATTIRPQGLQHELYRAGTGLCPRSPHG